MKKALLALVAVILVFTLAACGGGNNEKANNGGNNGGDAKSGPVTIIVTNGKGEIAQQFKDAAAAFTAANPDITVDVQSIQVGDELGPLEKLTAAGKTVTVAMLEPGALNDKYKGWGIDLSNEGWVSKTDSAIKDSETGKVVGFPFAIEGFGLVYNQKVLDKAVGGTFDPFSINTRDKLKALLDQIKASGVAKPVALQTEAWSVSNHYGTQFLNQENGGFTIIDKLKKGEYDLAADPIWNGYLETQRLLISKDYNLYAAKPLDKLYDAAHVAVGKGEAAMLFNGNWAFDSLKAVAGEKFGFIPVPADNNPDNPLNNKLVAGPTQVLAINAKASAAEQEAGKKFLDWIVNSKEGEDFLVNKSQVISAFKNHTAKVTNPLGVAIADAIAAGKTQPFSTNYVNGGDWFNIIGPEVQKYLIGKIEAPALAKAIQDHYKK